MSPYIVNDKKPKYKYTPDGFKKAIDDIKKIGDCITLGDSISGFEKNIQLAINDFTTFQQNFNAATNLAFAQLTGSIIGGIASGATAAQHAYLETFSGEILGYMNSGGSLIPFSLVPVSVKNAAATAATQAAIKAGGEAAAKDAIKDIGISFSEHVISNLGWIEPAGHAAHEIIDMTSEASAQTSEAIKAMQNTLIKQKDAYQKRKCP
jgi:hypothetical protein